MRKATSSYKRTERLRGTTLLHAVSPSLDGVPRLISLYRANPRVLTQSFVQTRPPRRPSALAPRWSFSRWTIISCGVISRTPSRHQGINILYYAKSAAVSITTLKNFYYVLVIFYSFIFLFTTILHQINTAPNSCY